MKPILSIDPEAAKFVENISGWVSRDGLFFGDNKDSEQMARFKGCTHVICKYCGNPVNKPFTAHEICREKRRLIHFNELPVGDWDGVSMLYSETKSKYFNDLDEVEEYAMEQGNSMADLRILICEPVSYRLIDEDYWEDCLPEEGELPDEIKKKLDELNDLLLNTEPVAWRPGKFRLLV